MSDDIKQFALKVGDTFSEEFDEMASAGYLWSCEVEDGGLEVISQTSFPDDGAIGAGCKRTFNAVAPAPGIYKINFTYGRPWEAEPVEIKRYVLNVEP